MKYPTFDFDRDKCLEFSENLKTKSEKIGYFGVLQNEYLLKHAKPDNVIEIFESDFFKWCMAKIKDYTESNRTIKLSINQAGLMVELLAEGKKWLRDSVQRWVEDEYELEICNFNKSDIADIQAVNNDTIVKAFFSYIVQEYSHISTKGNREIKEWAAKNADNIMSVLDRLPSCTEKTTMDFLKLLMSKRLQPKAKSGRPKKEWKKYLCNTLMLFYKQEKELTIEKSAGFVSTLFKELSDDQTINNLPKKIREPLERFLERLQLEEERVVKTYYENRCK